MGARRRILNALLRGEKLTSLEANRVGRTTEGGRRIRQIRENHPVLKEKVPGSKKHYRYFLDPAYVEEYQNKTGIRKVWAAIKSLF